LQFKGKWVRNNVLILLLELQRLQALFMIVGLLTSSNNMIMIKMTILHYKIFLSFTDIIVHLKEMK